MQHGDATNLVNRIAEVDGEDLEVSAVLQLSYQLAGSVNDRFCSSWCSYAYLRRLEYAFNGGAYLTIEPYAR